MNLTRFSAHWRLILVCTLLSAAGIGWQPAVGGQTLPSAYVLHDDVQYFPAGPEFILPRQVEALEEYKLRQQGAAGEAAAPAPAGIPVEVPPQQAQR